MTAIEAVHRSQISEMEASMFDQLRSLPAARTLPRGFLTNLYKQAKKPLLELAEATTIVLESPPADVKRAVDEKLSQMGEGDPVRGLQVFRGERASCSGCHRMGYIGREIGPDLTRIGRSRTAEALLEAILFPSARLEQSYQSTRVLTVDGQIFNGLIRSQDENAIELQLNAQRTETIPRSEIERMEASDVSVMPQGMNELLSNQELADLLALLKSAQ
jgi:putative heme-binding domain-containing protein